MIDKDLKIYDSVCTGCSACTEACMFPDESGINPIQLIINENGLNVPRINKVTCTECMKCYKACPTEDKIFNSDVTFDSYKAKIGNCYFGYSLDHEHRFEAATAGITTEIAAYLLDTKQVDGVISSYQNEDNDIITEIFTCSSEVKKTRGSIYRQVSALNGLGEKIESGRHKKLLFIGLSCHISGLKTLQKANKYLKKNVEFITIALFCKQTKTEEFSDMERSLLGAKPNQKINYRGKGWPGMTRVEGEKSLPLSDIRFGLMWGSFAFTPDYCFSCSDPIGLEADISVGDAWLSQYSADKIGSSLFVANTSKGDNIIKEMEKIGKIHLKRETVDNLLASQSTSHIIFKTSYSNARNALFGNVGAEDDTPNRYIKLIWWIKFNKKLVEWIFRSKIVTIIPNIILRVYAKISMVVFIRIFKHHPSTDSFNET
ncbi:MAG TPA: hypothetical protein EYG92_12455 [Lutibacter sp.]|nr:hypothetical protein [Lutibacter sp.]